MPSPGISISFTSSSGAISSSGALSWGFHPYLLGFLFLSPWFPSLSPGISISPSLSPGISISPSLSPGISISFTFRCPLLGFLSLSPGISISLYTSSSGVTFLYTPRPRVFLFFIHLVLGCYFSLYTSSSGVPFLYTPRPRVFLFFIFLFSAPLGNMISCSFLFLSPKPFA